ncbi:hypothetical protein OTK49_02675 [Vibrio coralliirubri]|uniref:DnaB-like helicase C-terminal domain-containing protein n=1 Tax=Vibrio coralliirubri TaxID=1516159 RepID=UPI002283E918|nr:DnaB-like helicase C-terminal domain-containing protein [Vibrio coralliirubri]MCY9861422.1 hypothetical protein [Vibrio coralliirubri]
MIINKKQILVGTQQHVVSKLLTFNDDATSKITEIISDDNLVVIVSPPSGGKTLLGMALANKLGGKDAIYSSAEMTVDTIKERLIPAISGKTLCELKQDPSKGIVALSKLAHYKIQEVLNCHTLDEALAEIAQKLSGSAEKQVVFLDAYSRFKIEEASSYYHVQEVRMEKLKEFATENNLLIITTEYATRSRASLSGLELTNDNIRSIAIDSLLVTERELCGAVIQSQLFTRS